MARPAFEARQKAQEIWPGATVLSRGKRAILHQHPTESNKFMEDTQTGGVWHIGNGPFTEANEVNTAWIPTSAPEDSPYIRKMDLADYKALFGNANLLFTPAFPFRYINSATGDFISWQANANLQWSNDQNSVANIGLTKQAISATIDDDELFFPGVYGSGIDFTLDLQTSRLVKKLSIASLATIGSPPQNIIDGGNPIMLLAFQFTRSAGVQIWVDGVQWAEATGQGNAVATVSTVEFRNSAGTVLWATPPAWAFDANGNQPLSVITRFRRAGPSFFIEYRLAWSWLQTAVFPIVLDPTIDTIVAAGADDASEADDGTSFSGVAVACRCESNTAAGSRFNGGMRFVLTGPASADTIDAAYLPIHAVSTSTDDPNVDMSCEDVDDAANFTTTADVTSRARTGAPVQWTATAIGAGEVNSPSIVAPLQLVINRAGWASGNAIVVFFDGRADVSASFRIDSFEGSTTECAKLHVEYTVPAVSGQGMLVDSHLVNRRGKLVRT